MASLPALAKDDFPAVTVDGIHLRDNWPNETASLPKNMIGKNVFPGDKACVDQQLAEIKKLSNKLDIDEIEIKLSYGKKGNSGNYAQVKKEKPYKIPLTGARFGEKKVLELGVTMPKMPSADSCSIVGVEALQKALDSQALENAVSIAVTGSRAASGTQGSSAASRGVTNNNGSKSNKVQVYVPGATSQGSSTGQSSAE
jgi:hypothetical protein